MQFSGVLQSPQFDLAGYLDKLHRSLDEQIKNAAREWLHATVVEVPVWSGASVATFLKLAAAVAFPLGARPVTGAPNRVSLGLGHSKGDLVTDKATGKYSFEYSTSLAHLVYNEFNNANTTPDATLFGQLLEPGPYNLQAKGKDAFDRAAAKVTLPKVSEFMSVRSTQV